MKNPPPPKSGKALDRKQKFKDELVAAGFSTRVANAIAFGTGVANLTELTERKWGERNTPGDLLYQLSTTPKLGVAGIAAVMAFREKTRPWDVFTHGPVMLTLRLSPEELLALDEWTETRGRALKRPEAVLELIRESLGLGSVDEVPDPQTG